MRKKIKVILNILFFVLWTSFFNLTLAASTSDNPSLQDALEKFDGLVNRKMAEDKAPGISVGFLKDNYTWTKGYGFSDLENKVKAKPESSYRMASITKTFTAMAILQLVEAGKINLDAEVQTYVPYFPRKKWPVTVRLLLGHLGGISHYKNYQEEGHIKVHMNTREALDIFDEFDLVAKPGTKFHYSSYGYNLLGAVVEGATGQSYGEYIKENIFQPLGMTNSRMDDPVDLIPHRVKGYRLIHGEVKNSEYVDVSSRFAAGGTRSTVVDLLKYAQGIMEGKLLKEKTWQKMFTSMITRGYLTGYGMGWVVRPWNGHFTVSHGGSQPETRTYIFIFPTENFAVAIASNLEHLNLMPYITNLAELVLKEDLDRKVYVADKEGQIIYKACQQVFSYGLSQYDWKNHHTAEDEKDLKQAFAYFNKYVSENSLNKEFKETKKKIQQGIHPVSGQALTKVGSYMASQLIPQGGKLTFSRYRSSGTLKFFSDYIQNSEDNFKFTENFTQLITNYKRDWDAVLTDYVQQLQISPETDFERLGAELKKTFAHKIIYPNYTNSMLKTAYYFLEKDRPKKSFQILNLAKNLYPLSPTPVSGLATAYLWTGDVEKARTFYKKAYKMNPHHPGVSLDTLENLARKMEAAHKIKEVFALAEISTELYPHNAQLQEKIGDLYLQAGKKKKAIQHYKKALKLNPELGEVKEKLKKIKKK